MTFYSPEFILIFLPCFAAIYAWLRGNMKDVFMFFGSMLFYYFACSGDFLAMAIIFCAALFNYFAGCIIGGCKGRSRRIAFAVFTAANAVALLSPKVMGTIGSAFGEEFSIIAPAGFSFYMFKCMSYLRQVYDKRCRPQVSFFALGAYFVNFAQVLSGPIQTFADFTAAKHKKMTVAMANDGLYEFIIGLSMKILLADKIIKVWSAGLYGINSVGIESVSTPLAWLGFISFPLYLYFEFYGYSLMSRGIGRMLGYETPDNFVYPYASRSVSEFWRRWHITLGDWFKENIYFPMGGSRCSKGKNILNLSVVWLCTGVWHALCFNGSSVNFMLWAAFLWVFIVLERLGILNAVTNKPLLSRVYLIVVILFSWVIFNPNIASLAELGTYFGRLFAAGGSPEYVNPQDWLVLLKESGVYMAVGVLFLSPLPRKLYEKYRNIKPLALAVFVALFWLSIYVIVCEGANPMVY